jgi:ligand-binding sensor domain-containing protein
MRGLSLITADEWVQDIGPRGIPITSLLAAADTLWVGTGSGLAYVVPGGTEMTIPFELRERPSMRVPIYALARLQDTIVMATERELFWREPATHAWTSVPLPPALGVPTALATTPQGGLWIGGTRGLAQAHIRSGLMEVHTVPFEIPAPVRDLTADRDYLWAATDSGLVRIQ